jgi:hypothetical protein
MLLNFLTFLVLAYVFSRLLAAVRYAMQAAVRAHVIEIVRGLRPRHLLLAPLVLLLVLTAASLLWQIPPLRFGWWTAIGGEGNPVIGATGETNGTPLDWIIPTVFLLLLVPALPLFAEREEQMFRQGAETWSWPHRIRRAIEFGLVHALIGIPIGVALALSIGGLYFTWRYLKGGVLESTRAHLAYNLEIVLLVAVVLATGSA